MGVLLPSSSWLLKLPNFGEQTGTGVFSLVIAVQRRNWYADVTIMSAQISLRKLANLESYH